jgi:hypothetical protein
MTTFNTSALKALFTYPFRQPNGQTKLVILGLFFFAGFIIPVVPWVFAMGYVAELMRRQALEGGEPELPEWEDWGRLGMDGLRMGVIGFGMSLPVLAIFLFGMGAYFLSFVPLIGSKGNEEELFGLMILAVTILMGTMILGMVLSFVLGLVSPSVLTHAAVKRSFAAALEVREWWGVLRANLGGYAIGLAIVVTFTYIVSSVSYLLFWIPVCCALGPLVMFVLTPYLWVIYAIVFGQVYREGQLKRAEGGGSPADAESTQAEPPQASEA